MTRAEGWLTVLGAALAFGAGVVVMRVLEGDHASSPYAWSAGALIAYPGVLALGTLVARNPGARVAILTAAVLIALPSALVAQFSLAPALAVLGVSAAVTTRRAAEPISSMWPMLLVVPTATAAWIGSGLVYLAATVQRCDQPDGAFVCVSTMSGWEFAGILALLSLPLALLGYLARRSPQPPARL